VKHPIFEDPDADPAPFITKSGLDKTCPVCVETLDLWTTIYGAEAGNLALKMMAVGGMYLGGGIAPKIIAKLAGPLFMQSFVSKGRFQALLENIPVRVITNDKTALMGAARCAAVNGGH